jgi:long-chain acyl-CoA synthetase
LTRTGTTRTFGAVLRRGRLVGGERTAVVCGDVRLTHRQLAARTQRLGDALARTGLLPGDRVAVLGANCHRYLELYLGLPAAGYVIVPINARHALPEIRYALQDAGVRVLFADREIEGIEDLGVRVIGMGEEYETLLQAADEVPWEDRGEHDLAGIFYTGGTTGAPKGVKVSHGNLVANAFAFMSCWPFTRETTWLVVAPLFHAAGTIGALATVWAGGSHVVLGPFDAGRFLDLVERERVTATLVVPAMMHALAGEQARAPRDVSSLRWLSHGSAPAAVELLRRTHEAFPGADLMHIYGATETSPIVTLLPGEQHLIDGPRATSCGQGAIGVEVRTTTDVTGGQACAVGEVGEVQVRGENVTSGYWNKPAETDEVLRDGWYSTGDLGYLDEEGFLFLVDRSKDMIVTGGENVYSAEVEDALHSHPAVAEAAVIAIPHERWGEAVHAVVTVAAGMSVTAEELMAHCAGRIASYKVPKSVDVRSEPLPRTAVGKILKRDLREPYWAGRETRIA